MRVYDAIIIGAGGMGSAVAYHAARRGQRVLAVDQFSPVHDQGSSHGRSRVIRKAYFEDPRYVPMLHRAYELWHELERETNEKLLHFCGVLNMGPAEHECIRGVRECVHQHNLPHEVVDANEINRRWPTFRPDPSDVGIFEADGGFHLPERAIQLHVQLAERAGAEFRWSTRVLNWSADDKCVRVRTAHDEFTAKHLVITAGAWLGDVTLGLVLPLKIERQVQFWWQPNDPALCRHDRMPAFIHFTGACAYYGIPSLADEGVKIARHHGGTITSPHEIDRSLQPEDEADVRAYIRKHVPNADGPLLSYAVCMYTNTPDDHFILDRHRQHENVIIAGGFSGHGFKFAPLVGKIVADMLASGHSDEPISLFSLDRLLKKLDDGTGAYAGDDFRMSTFGRRLRLAVRTADQNGDCIFTALGAIYREAMSESINLVKMIAYLTYCLGLTIPEAQLVLGTIPFLGSEPIDTLPADLRSRMIDAAISTDA